MIQPIIPTRCAEPFDDPAWLFELKYDGFRGIADTIGGRMLSKNKNRLRRFDRLLDRLPPGCVFDGEIVALDEAGRPVFNDLLFGRREPTYIAFDLLFVEGEDVREAPLKDRKALLEKIARRYGLERTEPFIGGGRPLFRAVCRVDLGWRIATDHEPSGSKCPTRAIRKKWIGRSCSSAERCENGLRALTDGLPTATMIQIMLQIQLVAELASVPDRYRVGSTGVAPLRISKCSCGEETLPV